MHVLVTGGAGFIGSHIVEHHLQAGHRVHVVDNLTTGRLANLKTFQGHPQFHFDEADILTWDQLDKVVGWADRIYHMAAVVGMYKVLHEPIQVMSTNISACERLLRSVAASSWGPQVLIASSSEVYGHCDSPVLHEDDNLVIPAAAHMRWNYAISKLADEAFALSYARRFGLPIVVARLFNTVGPRQTGRYGMVIPRFVTQAVHGEPVTVFGDGRQTRSFCDVRDTVKLLDELVGAPAASGTVVNVGQDVEISIEALARRTIELAGSNSTIERISYVEAYGEDYEDISRRRPSLERLRELTRFDPQWTLDDTLKDLIDMAERQTHAA